MAEKKTADKSTTDGFTAEERTAMKERAQETKKGRRTKKDGEGDVLAKIAVMPDADRVMAERIHAIVKETAPELSPKTWYGQPAYANEEGKLVVFFQSADKYKTKYATLGFEEVANLADSNMWPTSFALKKLTAAEEKQIAELVKKAVS